MIIDGKIKLLGDTHLGREFVRNVPLHRRGDREKMVWAQFEKELNPEGCEVHIHMGDLFDKPVVSNNVVLRAARLYKKAAQTYPGTLFCILAGNHDLSRDLEATSSFELFKAIVASVKNIDVVTNEPLSLSGVSAVLCPWHPIVSAAEIGQSVVMLSKVVTEFKHRYAFGHWDVDPRSAPFNLIPTLQLSTAGVERAFTGHVHLPTQFKRDGVDVTVVGSMAPFAHGEDADGSIYKTMTLDEFDATDPASLRDCCLRIRLNEGEVWDREIDCLQLQIEKVSAEAVEVIDVSLGEFDLQSIFDGRIKKANLPAPVEQELRTKWSAAFT